MVKQITSEKTAWGNTNFNSVIQEIVRMRKQHPEIPVEEYPGTLLVVSDMQFDKPPRDYMTNYEHMKAELYEVLPKEFVDNMKFIWWQVTGRTKDVPAEVGPGQMFISGFDGSIISLLLGSEAKELEQEKGRPLTSEEVVQLGLSQEILSYITAQHYWQYYYIGGVAIFKFN